MAKVFKVWWAAAFVLFAAHVVMVLVELLGVSQGSTYQIRLFDTALCSFLVDVAVLTKLYQWAKASDLEVEHAD